MASSVIPVDYTVRSTGFLSVLSGDFIINDAADNLCFRVSTSRCCDSPLMPAPVPPCTWRTVVNYAGIPLISSVHLGDGNWQGFAGCSDTRRLIFYARRFHTSPFHVEVEVNMAWEWYGLRGCSFRLKGNPFQRSCTVYRGCSIVAQTSLQYKLGKVLNSKKKFRLTVYPGMDDALALALLVIFFG